LRKLRPADHGNRSFGYSVSLFEEIAVVGAHLDDDVAYHAGAAYVFDVLTGRQVYKLTASDGDTNDYFGWSVAVQDHLIVVGARTYAYGNPPRRAAFGFVLEAISYGPACPGSGGIEPSYAILGDMEPGGIIDLDLRDAVGGSVAFIAVGFGKASLPMGAGCVLNIAPPIFQLNGPFPLYPVGGTGPGVGWLDIPVAIPATAPSGLTFTSQMFIVDPGAPRGFTATNGVEATFR